ncbi:MAG: ATP-dependent DNA helicase UvrD2 [Actinomycetaceae bacterium]|nr:ATP-dependent DNA helicase UvrD2 [Actinomycetaceae bacterium]
MNKFAAEKLLDALDPQQRQVAEQVRGPLVVRAGAGTGKTRAITYKIAYGVASGAYDVHDVLAVTFTTRAAREMGVRLRSLGAAGVQTRTFHSAALRQLRYFWPTAVGGTPPQLVEHKAPLVAAAATRLGIATDRASIRDLAGEIEWAKVSLIPVADYPKRVRDLGRALPNQMTPEQVAQLLAVYQDVKSERAVIDFEDVLLLTAGMIAERPDIARQIRAQYRHFVVDEFQDVSPLQYELLSQWLGGRNDICVVGDASQTIYSFTGASSKYLRDFPRHFEGAREIELVRNYRSSAQIVSLANHLVRGMPKDEAAGAVTLQAVRAHGQAINFAIYPDDAQEATAIVKRIIELRDRGVPLKNQAILYRVNSQSRNFEDALNDRAISYQVRGGEKFFERQEVRKMIVLVRAKARTQPTQDVAEAVAECAAELGWTSSAPQTQGALREKWEALDALVNLAKDRRDEGVDIQTLATELTDRASAGHAIEVDAVTLSTIHAAKGLEWDAVFLVGTSEGLLPIAQAKTRAEISEEHRLAYVGVTRAQKFLHISYAKARAADRRASRKVSRFFAPMWPEQTRTKVTAKGVLGKPGKQGVRSARSEHQEFLDTATPAQKQTFEQLRQWRKEVSKLVSKPAFTITADATLSDIAIARPRTLRQLSLIRGIGRVKLEEYGPAILAVLRGDDPVGTARAQFSTDQ